MENAVMLILEAIVGGGPGAIIAILTSLNVVFGFFIYKLWGQLNKRDDKIDKIIEDYSKNNITITEALNGLKMVLVEIKAKI